MSNKEVKHMYEGASITNIHRGKGDREEIVFAYIVGLDGKVLVHATLDYCVELMKEYSKFWK